MFDLEPVCKVAQNYIEKSNLPPGFVKTYSGDFFKEPFPDCSDAEYGYQGMLYSNVLHDWSEQKCKHLVKKSFDSLPDNGTILIHEALLNDDGNGPLEAAYLSFKMFIGTEGKQFTFTELKDLLSETGFKNIGVIPTYGMFSVVYGIKKNSD